MHYWLGVEVGMKIKLVHLWLLRERSWPKSLDGEGKSDALVGQVGILPSTWNKILNIYYTENKFWIFGYKGFYLTFSEVYQKKSSWAKICGVKDSSGKYASNPLLQNINFTEIFLYWYFYKVWSGSKLMKMRAVHGSFIEVRDCT